MDKNPFQRQEFLQREAHIEHQTAYQRLYGLRENPFPPLAMFTPSIDDPRRDGRIYDEAFRKKEEKQFFDLFIQSPTGDRPLELGFIRLDPQAGGRGNGKSVFLHHIAERINKQEWHAAWNPNLDDPHLYALAVHLLPEPRKQKRFWQLIYLVFVTLANENLFANIDVNFRAAVLYQMLSEEQIASLSRRPPADLQKSLQSNENFSILLEEVGFTRSAYLEEAKRQLELVAPSKLNARFFREFILVDCSLERLWEKWKKEGFAPNDYQWRNHGVSFFSEGLVPVTIVAGYRRFFLLLDEFEKIYMYQNNLERDEFLDSLRQYFYERDSTIVRNRYVTTAITIHPSIDRYLARNWQRVGLGGLVPLDPRRIAACSIELGASTTAKLLHLVMTYIDYFRIKKDDLHFETLYPFSEDALEPAVEAARYYPRDTLWFANAILKKSAMKELAPPITREFVENFILSGEKPPVDDDEELFSLPTTLNDLNG